jgi:MarR family transcriptional regulator, organic hydroperoxide resistance regulator
MADNICVGISALLVQVARLNRQEGERVLQAAGIRPGQEFVLGALWEADGQRPGDIAKRLGVTPAVLTKHVHNLTKVGLVDVRDDETDRRASRIFLTSNGAKLREQVADGINRLEHALLGSLDQDERLVFQELLERILAKSL